MTVLEEDASTGLVDVREVERLAGWAARLGPVWARDDMRGEASLRVLEALDAGCTAGLGRIAYRGAMSSFRQATYQSGDRMSRTARELGVARTALVPTTVAPTAWWDGDVSAGLAEGIGGRCRGDVLEADQLFDWMLASGSTWADGGDEDDELELGPVLDRLVKVLEARGLARAEVTAALLALTDAAGDTEHVLPTRSGVRSGVADLSDRAMSARSGLSPAQCGVLRILVMGERARSDRNAEAVPGLVARAHQGDDVWSDPRVLAMLDAVVAPTVRLRRPWSRQAPPSTTTSAGRVVS